MESTVLLKTDYSVELNDTLYTYNEVHNCIEKLRVLEIHKVKLPSKGEDGFPEFKTPRFCEMVYVESNIENKGKLLLLSDVWKTPEEAMDGFSKKKLSQYKK